MARQIFGKEMPISDPITRGKDNTPTLLAAQQQKVLRHAGQGGSFNTNRLLNRPSGAKRFMGGRS